MNHKFKFVLVILDNIVLKSVTVVFWIFEVRRMVLFICGFVFVELDCAKTLFIYLFSVGVRSSEPRWL